MRTCLLLVLLTFTFNAITQEYFNERFGFEEVDGADNGYNTIAVEDGYVVSGGTTGIIIQNYFRFGITKYSLNGQILLNKSWGDDSSIWYSETHGSLQKHFNNYYTLNANRGSSFLKKKLIKYNSNFDTVYTITYKSSEYPHDTNYIGRSFNGTINGFVIVGTLEILHDLKTREKLSYNKSNSECLLYPTERKDWYSTHELFLLKLDSLGNVIWEKNFPYEIIERESNGFQSVSASDEKFADSILRSSGYSVIQTTDGGYAIGAYKWYIGSYGAAIGDPVVIKTDSLGNTEWEINLGGPYQDGTAIVCKSDDSNIVVASRYDLDSIYHDKYNSRVQITKVDLEGNVIWNNLYTDKHIYMTVANLRTDSAGGFVVSGISANTNWPDEPSRMGYMLRINSFGDSLWYRQYAVLWDKSSDNYFYDAIPTNDGGFVGAGSCFPLGADTGNQDAWLIKVDSMGCTNITDCWVSVPEWEWITTESGNKIKVYPNPAHNWFEVEIKTNNKKDKNLTIEVFDLYGRIKEEVETPKGKSSARLYVSDWNKGVYLVKVKDNMGIVGSGKVIVR